VEEADFRDSEHIVSIGDDGRLMEWSPGGSDKIVLFTHTSALFRLEVLPTGRRIAVVDTAGSVWVVSPSGDVKQIRAANGDTATALKASSDGRLLAIGTGQGTIIVYDTITWQVVATLNSGGGVRQIQFDPLGRDLLIAFEAGRSFVGHVHLLPLNSRRSYRWSDVPAKVRAVAYAPDGETIAFVCADGSTWLYSMRDDLWSYENNHRIDTLIVRFSPDGRLLATGDRRGAVVVRNLNLMFPANQR
jgi:WD40 repeat protein